MNDSQATSPATEEQPPAGEDTAPGPPGFAARGRMRRRLRFLRKARELAYRDLGGLVYNLHRFGRRNDALVLAKLDTIGRIDSELRALESALSERQSVTVISEAGVAACPRCAAIHGSDDSFCPNCGLAMDLRAERPVAGAPAPTAAPPAPAAAFAGASAAPDAPAFSAADAPASAPAAPAAAADAPSGGPPSPATTAAEPAAPAPSAPAQPAAPATRTGEPGTATPASAPESTPATTAPAGPAPSVEEPTEIIRPPVESS